MVFLYAHAFSPDLWRAVTCAASAWVMKCMIKKITIKWEHLFNQVISISYIPVFLFHFPITSLSFMYLILFSVHPVASQTSHTFGYKFICSPSGPQMRNGKNASQLLVVKHNLSKETPPKRQQMKSRNQKPTNWKASNTTCDLHSLPTVDLICQTTHVTQSIPKESIKSQYEL